MNEVKLNDIEPAEEKLELFHSENKNNIYVYQILMCP